MKRFSLVALALLPALALLLPVHAQAPAKLEQVVPVGDLEAEIQAKLETLQELLADEATWAQSREKQLPQNAGALAVLAQALAEHPQNKAGKIAGPSLRDAAIAVFKSDTYDAAKAALQRASAAAAGKASGEAKTEHPWNQIAPLKHLMHEVNYRNARLSRAVRRLRNPNEDSLHASTLAVLALVVHEDTHEVKDKSEIPKWQEYSKQLQQAMTEASAAMKKEDKSAAMAARLKANQACNACHKTFRIELAE